MAQPWPGFVGSLQNDDRGLPRGGGGNTEVKLVQRQGYIDPDGSPSWDGPATKMILTVKIKTVLPRRIKMGPTSGGQK